MEIKELKSFDNTKYSSDYYEDGLKKKLSGYEHYHYIPTRSFPEAIEICERFDFKTAIDFGCAKGFLVHTLRQLGKEAYGEDISDYALSNCHPPAKPYLSFPNGNKADLIICKDVMEHMYENEVDEILSFLKNKCEKEILLIIPLGDDNTFRIREYEVDITHVTKKDEDWWINKIRDSGFRLKSFSYSMGVIKKHWTDPHPFGNGFFIIDKGENAL